MPVTKQTYSAAANWTSENAANILRSAFIDAGIMTDWYDSFSIGANIVRVLKVEYNGAKVYGASFYAFAFVDGYLNVHLASDWKASGTAPINIPIGTQYIDYRWLPANYSINYGSVVSTDSQTSVLYLDRYTSASDSKQSWFVFRSGLSVSRPFTILRGDTALHSWLNLDKGIISGYQRIFPSVVSRAGYIAFAVEENLRRCLLTGTAVSGQQTHVGFHNMRAITRSYAGLGSEASDGSWSNNFPVGGYQNSSASCSILPVGRNAANPAYTTDYIPICSDLEWSPFTPTRLANDFGVYMHYADNAIDYGDRFVVQSGINEWEVVAIANNNYVNVGASAAFLARVV